MHDQNRDTERSNKFAFLICPKTAKHFSLWTLNNPKWLLLLTMLIVNLFNGSIISAANGSEIESPLRIKAASEIEVKREYLKHIISQQERLLTSLVDTPFMNAYIAKNQESDRDSLSELFLTAATINKHYMQVRFIDAQGQEKIRIEQSNNNLAPMIIKEAALQDKSRREYFTATQKTPAGELWHSAFDLNREQGTIEQLINPTYRIAHPVYFDGAFSGMVIINLDMTSVLNYLTESNDFLIYLVDSDDELLIHPNAKKSWSKYLPGRSKYLQKNALRSESMTHSLEDIFKNGEGIRIILQEKKSNESSTKD